MEVSVWCSFFGFMYQFPVILMTHILLDLTIWHSCEKKKREEFVTVQTKHESCTFFGVIWKLLLESGGLDMHFAQVEAPFSFSAPLFDVIHVKRANGSFYLQFR